MDKRILEWLKQADYDIDTAKVMAKGGRYFYAVFMCHLRIEKALKGLYEQTLQEVPPRQIHTGYYRADSDADPGDSGVDKEAVLRIICDFGKALETERIKPQRIILFGSYSTGTQREGSDIDLVVISEDFAGKDYWERIDILSTAIYTVFAPIEATAMTPREWESGESRIVDFARNGEVVYG